MHPHPTPFYFLFSFKACENEERVLLRSSSLALWPKSATDSEGINILSPGVDLVLFMLWHGVFVHVFVGCSWHCSQAVGRCWKLRDGHRHFIQHKEV